MAAVWQRSSGYDMKNMMHDRKILINWTAKLTTSVQQITLIKQRKKFTERRKSLQHTFMMKTYFQSKEFSSQC